ncbi:uncharacterized protein LOC113366855 [Ctenocephalides felis]|uniref:uncharacterized protein LOC113366855 n=1 Tax=Ctenocephalides felis TaxID=7515 RepID=UPI000E6E2687|nr:uncharacterized protein LOC113366855 [Ctenocephalides felis]
MGFAEKYEARKAIEKYDTAKIVALLKLGLKLHQLQFWKNEISRSDSQALLNFVDQLKENPDTYYKYFLEATVGVKNNNEGYESDDSFDSVDQVYQNDEEDDLHGSSSRIEPALTYENDVRNEERSPSLPQKPDRFKSLPQKDEQPTRNVSHEKSKPPTKLPKIISNLHESNGFKQPINPEPAPEEEQILQEELDKLLRNSTLSTKLAQALKDRLKNTPSSSDHITPSTSKDQNRPTTSNFNELRKIIESSLVSNTREDKIQPEGEDDGYAQMSPRHALSSNIQNKKSISRSIKEFNEDRVSHYDSSRSNAPISNNERFKNKNQPSSTSSSNLVDKNTNDLTNAKEGKGNQKFQSSLDRVLSFKKNLPLQKTEPESDDDEYVVPINEELPISSSGFRPLPSIPIEVELPQGRAPPLPIVNDLDSFEREVEENPNYRNVTRQDGISLLEQKKDGTFLIRPSGTGSGYAVMLQFRRQFYNIKIIKKEGGKFALMNNKDGSLCFSKLSSLLNYYREGVELLLLQSGDRIFGETHLYPL